MTVLTVCIMSPVIFTTFKSERVKYRELSMWNSHLGGASCKSDFCNMVCSLHMQRTGHKLCKSQVCMKHHPNDSLKNIMVFPILTSTALFQISLPPNTVYMHIFLTDCWIKC